MICMGIDRKKRFFSQFDRWEDAEAAWEGRRIPLEVFCTTPQVPCIDPSLRHLRFRSFLHLIRKDTNFILIKALLRHPFYYAWRYLCSFFSKKVLVRESSCCLCNVENKKTFLKELFSQDSVCIFGFSYCQKPKNCPKIRFSSECIADPDNSVCRSCFIGKIYHALPNDKKIIFTIITTANEIGNAVFRAMNQHPDKKILFIITSCEMAFTLFAPFGYMVNVQGIGLRLCGRFCNTWKAFSLSEEGIKPGQTMLSYDAEKFLLSIAKQFFS